MISANGGTADVLTFRRHDGQWIVSGFYSYFNVWVKKNELDFHANEDHSLFLLYSSLLEQ